MNRFESEPHSLTSSCDRDEDGYPSFKCDYCNDETPTLEIAAWDSTLRVCAACACAEPEPECTCTQTDVDMFSAIGCEFHDSTSPWNAHRRAIERVQMRDEVEEMTPERIKLVQMLEAAGCTPDEVTAWEKMTPQRAIAELKQREVA